MSVRDMYADLEKIEARGKRKKEKSKGLFSSFGKKDEHEPEEPIKTQPESVETEAPKTEPAVPKPQPAAEPTPVVQSPPAKPAVRAPKPAETAVKPAAKTPPPKPEPKRAAAKPWKPLSGGKLKKAEEELIAYKKWINQGFKSGVLTKQQCIAMVHIKEIELGLRPGE